jgi:hypothetical protein
MTSLNFTAMQVCFPHVLKQAQPILASELGEWKAKSELLNLWERQLSMYSHLNEDESQPW